MVKPIKRMYGATLLEMMISLFVMGVGMMGVLGMQTQAVRFNHQAYSYSQAVFLAQEIMESIRANKTAAASYKVALGGGSSTAKNCSVMNANCSHSQLKDWDIKAWQEKVAKRLPAGKGGIAYDGTTYTVTLEFDLIPMDKQREKSTEQSLDNERQSYTLKAGL